MNRQSFNNKKQMPNLDRLFDVVSQIIFEEKIGLLYFTLLDLKLASF